MHMRYDDITVDGKSLFFNQHAPMLAFLAMHGWEVSFSSKLVNNMPKRYKNTFVPQYFARKGDFTLLFTKQENGIFVDGGVFVTACEDLSFEKNNDEEWWAQEKMLKNKNTGEPIFVGFSAGFDSQHKYKWDFGINDDIEIAQGKPYLLADGYINEEKGTETYIFTFVQPIEEEVAVGYGDYYNSDKKKDVIIKNYYQYFCVAKVGYSKGKPIWVITGSMSGDNIPFTIDEAYTYAARNELGEKLVDDQGNYYAEKNKDGGYIMFGTSCIDVKKVNTLSKIPFGMASVANTFALIHVDSADEERGIYWASAGDSQLTYTGKLLATSACRNDFTSRVPKVPHLGYLQAASSTDVGRNSNTLNGITAGLPVALYVLRDPDKLGNYSQIGYVDNFSIISLKNLADGKRYEIGYPKSGNLDMVYPIFCRRGSGHGFDGIAIPRPSDEIVVTEEMLRNTYFLNELAGFREERNIYGDKKPNE